MQTGRSDPLVPASEGGGKLRIAGQEACDVHGELEWRRWPVAFLRRTLSREYWVPIGVLDEAGEYRRARGPWNGFREPILRPASRAARVLTLTEAEDAVERTLLDKNFPQVGAAVASG